MEATKIMRCLKNKISVIQDQCRAVAGSPWFRITAWVITMSMVAAYLSYTHRCWLNAGESGSTTVRNIGLVVAAVIALPIAIWRSVVAERQVKTAQRSLMNERYQKGAEMLGSQVLAVRLGGINALGDLAREHPEIYHTKILSLLCAFVRHPTREAGDEGDNDQACIRKDVQDVMYTINARTKTQTEKEKQENYILNLDHSNLKNSFLGGVDLTEANLTSANLNHAWLEGANLNDASLLGAHLQGANLRRAKLKRVKTLGVYLNHACLREADLTGAYLNDAHLNRADLSGADLRDCKGLTQECIDQAEADSDDPPNLESAVDANTGKPLVWTGKPVM